jgi:hypothetical protein
MERRNKQNKESLYIIRVRIGVSVLPLLSVLLIKVFWYILVPLFQNLENLHSRMEFRRFLVERVLEQAWNELIVVPSLLNHPLHHNTCRFSTFAQNWAKAHAMRLFRTPYPRAEKPLYA